MSNIASICARGGSQGVPRKNIRMLCGKPLIVHTIELAKQCQFIDYVFVSTDDKEIARIAEEAGAIVPFIRPAELATSEAGKIPVIQHLVSEVEKSGIKVDKIIDLDPTSPLRILSDVEECYELLDDVTDIVITGYEAEKNPYFNMVEKKEDSNYALVKKLKSGVVRRQDAPNVYSMNASVYVWHRHSLDKGLWDGIVKLHVMPRERSIDIDHEVDFMLVELLMCGDKNHVK